jgi:hypothetical protein
MSSSSLTSTSFPVGTLKFITFGPNFDQLLAKVQDGKITSFESTGTVELNTITMQIIKEKASQIEIDRADEINHIVVKTLRDLLSPSFNAMFIGSCCGIVMIIAGIHTVLNYFDLFDEDLRDRTLYTPVNPEYTQSHATTTLSTSFNSNPNLRDDQKKILIGILRYYIDYYPPQNAKEVKDREEFMLSVMYVFGFSLYDVGELLKEQINAPEPIPNILTRTKAISILLVKGEDNDDYKQDKLCIQKLNELGCSVLELGKFFLSVVDTFHKVKFSTDIFQNNQVFCAEGLSHKCIHYGLKLKNNNEGKIQDDKEEEKVSTNKEIPEDKEENEKLNYGIMYPLPEQIVSNESILQQVHETINHRNQGDIYIENILMLEQLKSCVVLEHFKSSWAVITVGIIRFIGNIWNAQEFVSKLTAPEEWLTTIESFECQSINDNGPTDVLETLPENII